MVAPPNTDLGIKPTKAASLGKSPREIKIPATANPTRRAATPVKPMTPLFCENVVLGMELKMPASRLPKPSASIPPSSLRMKTGP